MCGGGRLLGSCIIDITNYTRFDVNKDLEQPYKRMIAELKLITKTNIDVRFTVSLKVHYNKINYDMVFTSPPFFDKEMYSFNMNQSFRKYPTYKDWLDNWLMTVVKKSTDKLTRNGKLVIWIGHSDDHNITEDFLISSHNILTLVDVIYFEMPKNVYNSKAGDSYRREKFLVMQRK